MLLSKSTAVTRPRMRIVNSARIHYVLPHAGKTTNGVVTRGWMRAA